MRLGIYPCDLQEGTVAARAYGKARVDERHRHRWEFNNDYRELLNKEGMVYSGLSPDDRLVEIAELEDHPFMLGCQFHPEFKSRPNHPHPLFDAFLRAAVEHQEQRNGRRNDIKVEHKVSSKNVEGITLIEDSSLLTRHEIDGAQENTAAA